MDPKIRLSHSLAESFCPAQEYFKRILGHWDHEKYDYAKGHLAEYIAYAYLNALRTGAPSSSLRDAGYQKLKELCNEMEYADYQKLAERFDGLLDGVINYCNSVDYTPVNLSKRFSLKAKGFTRVITGEMDIVGELPCKKPIIIDLKYQEKPLTKKSFDLYKQGWVRQLVLYAMAYMTMNKTETPPLLEIHVIVYNGEPQRFSVACTEDVMYTVLDNLHNLNLRLDADYCPMNRGHKLCSDRWCHVYGLCHQRNRLEYNKILDRLDTIV